MPTSKGGKGTTVEIKSFNTKQKIFKKVDFKNFIFLSFCLLSIA